MLSGTLIEWDEPAKVNNNYSGICEILTEASVPHLNPGKALSRSEQVSDSKEPALLFRKHPDFFPKIPKEISYNEY